MQVSAGRVWLLLLVTTEAAAGQLRRAPPTGSLKLAPPLPIKIDQENSLPAIKTPDGMHRNSGELGLNEQPASARTSRHRQTTTWAPGDDVDFIRVDPSVQTSISNQQRPNSIGPGPASSSSQEKHARTTTTDKPAEPAAERSAALESLNRFLLERPTQLDKTSGAISGHQLALRQSAVSRATPLQNATSTTMSPQFDYLTRLYLDSSMQLEVRAHLGETAYLLCRLRANLQQSDQLQVSWFRNVEILTSGEMRYTSDERFRPSHQPGSNDWLLELHNVRASDEGDYECQVNSTPRSASVRVRLIVIATSLEILEGPEVRVGTGEQVELTCRVQFASQAQLRSDLHDDEPPDGTKRPTELGRGGRPRLRRSSIAATSWQPYIYWYKDQVYLQDNRVQKQQRNLTSGGLENVLRVSRASQSDSGSYTCKLVPELTEVRPAQAQVFVLASGSLSLKPGLSGAILLLVASITIHANWKLVIRLEKL